jgi:hypothetical protein
LTGERYEPNGRKIVAKKKKAAVKFRAGYVVKMWFNVDLKARTLEDAIVEAQKRKGDGPFPLLDCMADNACNDYLVYLQSVEDMNALEDF